MDQASHLPNKIKTVWKVSAFLTFIVTAGIFIAAFFIGSYSNWNWLIYASYAVLALGVVMLIVRLALIPYRYTFFKYLLTDDAVQIQSGFIFRKLISVPIARVQDVKISQGPVLRSQKLQSVNITTASTDHDIDGLEPDTAEQLRIQIMQRAMKEVENDL
ncbi:PH domain-containing protein [Lentilactobacillus kosonis]|uniref:YdbS-like PH domain-containing protein n=1 Tax=Lentilactobacillus kosonis TaxID=2810561 RepID=A0A401FIS3_9LACO|nr:PH domain-containing protein [Lentilactobacillus kosonis]GAY72186.1 hypothetical protein, ydbS homolog [Lentilactobacillus kosonis]